MARSNHPAGDPVEAQEIAEDLAAQAVAPAGDVPRLHRLAPGFVRAVHPEHGQTVIYTPGEALPEWAAALLDSGAARTAGDGVLDLTPAPVDDGGAEA